jgi:serine/threonine protein phosphatase 1
MISKKTYVVPDLHGRFDLLKLAISNIEKNEPGTVIFTGDYIDRGPQSREVIDEDMLMQASQSWLKIRQWLRNGGDATLRSYGSKTGSMLDISRVEPTHVEWLKTLPLFHQDEHRVYVNAGLDDGVALDRQSKHTLIWKRYPSGSKEEYGALHVVHGHDPSEDGPLLLANRTDLDAGAYYTGRLVVGVFDDALPGGPVDLIESTIR